MRRYLSVHQLSASLLFCVAALEMPAQPGSLDPAFARVPFDHWFSGGGQAHIRWTASVAPSQLSIHQRLMARVDLQLDGADLAKRRGRGQLVIFFQISDRDGARYQDHGVIQLDKVEEGIKQQDIIYTESAFVLPGDYDISLAIYDTATEEHGTKRLKLRVAPLKNDPLPDAWHDLPPVEWVSEMEPPDRWYQPALHGRLHLPVQVSHPVRIQLLVNLTPSERLSGLQRIQDRNLGMLIPALKTFSQVDFQNASVDVALLDLTRRRSVFHQEQVHALNWPLLKESLSASNPGTIDVASLGNRSRSAAFFVSEVKKRIGVEEKSSSGPSSVLIILSSPVAFEDGVDLEPIQPAPGTAGPIYYFRMHAPPAARLPGGPAGRFGLPGLGSPPMRRGGLGPPGIGTPRPPALQAAQIDQLEPTLKPLAPRLFDIETPEQFRKALATVLEEVAKM